MLFVINHPPKGGVVIFIRRYGEEKSPRKSKVFVKRPIDDNPTKLILARSQIIGWGLVVLAATEHHKLQRQSGTFFAVIMLIDRLIISAWLGEEGGDVKYYYGRLIVFKRFDLMFL